MRRDSRLSGVLHVLLHMAEQDGPVTSEVLARVMATNPAVIRRVMAGLRDQGYVRSEKGHGGGWTLARPLDAIRILDIYRAVGEPRIFSIGPADPDPQCLVEQAVNASMAAAMQEAEAMLIARLGQVTLAQIAADFDQRYAALLATGRVRKIICSFPRQADSHVFDGLYRAGRIELELVPQGNLAERLRAAGAGIGAFFTPTGFGTELARRPDGSPKETRRIDGRDHVLEYPIHGDVALIRAERGDRWGNLTYRQAARNFGPVMAMAARCTVASVHEVLELGQLDPEAIVTPGIFVHRVVRVPRVATAAGGLRSAA